MKAIVLIIVAIVAAWFTIWHVSTEKLEVTIKNTEVTVSGNDVSTNSKYLVFTNNEVFENTDSWTFFKFNSSDVQNKFEPGKTYKIKVVGWRVPFLSMYRNVIEVQE